MSCPPEIKKDSYEFFEDIENYIKYAEQIKSTATSGVITTCCTSLMNGKNTLGNTEIARNICQNFLKLYNMLPNVKNFNEKDWGFLNYWLNFELGQVNNNICVRAFYDDIENQCFHNMKGVLLKDLMYNFKNDDLNKRIKLYNLHKKYSELNNIINTTPQIDKESLFTISTKCCSDYIDANYMCDGENNQFCVHLNGFRTKYEGLYKTVDEKGLDYSNNFIKLSQCDNNTMSKALIGTTVGLVPLLVGLYKVK
ncbi:hypothetical protein PVIIG_05748 [Plasmodium vivax India VII]|uniref:Uncharacterized protein n=1 Tax=Plasmodium vivax India VII TaxID=1077284 RepID=A0A0J9SJT2_PLAVI|nr:hypothetical protein PVIIG_05748 [Plasmodium vivax India VII]